MPTKVKTLPACSKSTYSRALKRGKIKTFKTIKKNKLDEEIKSERLNYCSHYLQLNQDQPNIFDSHIYTDESTFYNYSLNTFTRSLNGRHSDVSNYSENPTRRFKVNFYGVLSKYTFTLIRISGNFTQLKFRNLMINQNMLSYFQSIVPGIPFVVQDNSNLHQFDDDYPITFMQECINRNIQLVNFPRYSPDLNIIENIWGHLKNKLSESLTINQVNNINQLFERVEQISRNEITIDFIKSLYDSINYRLETVINLNGEMINY